MKKKYIYVAYYEYITMGNNDANVSSTFNIKGVYTTKAKALKRCQELLNYLPMEDAELSDNSSNPSESSLDKVWYTQKFLIKKIPLIISKNHFPKNIYMTFNGYENYGDIIFGNPKDRSSKAFDNLSAIKKYMIPDSIRDISESIDDKATPKNLIWNKHGYYQYNYNSIIYNSSIYMYHLRLNQGIVSGKIFYIKDIQTKPVRHMIVEYTSKNNLLINDQTKLLKIRLKKHNNNYLFNATKEVNTKKNIYLSHTIFKVYGYFNPKEIILNDNGFSCANNIQDELVYEDKIRFDTNKFHNCFIKQTLQTIKTFLIAKRNDKVTYQLGRKILPTLNAFQLVALIDSLNFYSNHHTLKHDYYHHFSNYLYKGLQGQDGYDIPKKLNKHQLTISKRAISYAKNNFKKYIKSNSDNTKKASSFEKRFLNSTTNALAKL